MGTNAGLQQHMGNQHAAMRGQQVGPTPASSVAVSAVSSAQHHAKAPGLGAFAAPGSSASAAGNPAAQKAGGGSAAEAGDPTSAMEVAAGGGPDSASTYNPTPIQRPQGNKNLTLFDLSQS